MLQRRVIPSTCPWRSIRFVSQLSPNLADGEPADSARKSSILSRLSDRTQSRSRHDSHREQKNPSGHADVVAATRKIPRPRATSFISTQSAQKRDNAAEKWFTDVRELDVNKVDQPGLNSLPRKKRMGSLPRHHEMRPRTDLNALFAPSITRSTIALRVRNKRELGGDYTSYLPDRYADPYRFPIAYARLVLGRNKNIPLNAQAGALNIIEEAIRGNTTRPGK